MRALTVSAMRGFAKADGLATVKLSAPVEWKSTGHEGKKALLRTMARALENLSEEAFQELADLAEDDVVRAEAMAMLKEAGMATPERRKYWRFYENRDAALACHTAHQRERASHSVSGTALPALRDWLRLGFAQRSLLLTDCQEDANKNRRRIRHRTTPSQYRALVPDDLIHANEKAVLPEGSRAVPAPFRYLCR